MSIKYKIVLYTLVVVFFVITIVSYNYLQYTQKNIKELSVKQLESIGHITFNRLESFLKKNQEYVQLFNSRLLLQKQLLAYKNNTNSKSISILKDILNRSYTNNGNIEDIIILDTKANLILSKSGKINNNDMFLKSMFKKSFKQSASHLSFITKDNTPIFCIAQPIYNNKIFVGITVFKIELTELNNMVKEREGLDSTGEAVLGTFHNNNIVLFTPLRFSTYPLVIPNKHSTVMKIALENGEHKIIYSGIDYRNKNVISSLHYYEPLKIGIVIKKDINELMQPIEELKNILIVITSLGILFSILISYIYSAYIIKIINKTAKTISNISNGDFKDRINISNNDEFGFIASSVNKMTDTLVELTQTLEAKVKIKTKLLSETNAKLNHIFDITPNITLITDGRTIIKANIKFLEFTGYEDIESFLKDYNCICDMFEHQTGYLKAKIDGKSWIEYIISHPNETHKALIKIDEDENIFLVNATSFIEGEETHYLAIFENVTELQKIAYTDQLTSLSNRLKIDEILEKSIQNNQRYKRIFSILFLDIDNFKKVNDNYGHLIGDAILKSIALILKEHTRNLDFIGRWGGEEFIIISQETDIDGAKIIGEKIRKAIESYTFTKELKQTVSIGITQYRDNEDVDNLIKRADNALYEAKEHGRNKIKTIS